MAIQIITDSTCDLSPEQAAALGVTVVPLRVRFGEREYIDGVELTKAQFYQLLSESRELPTTSQINPDAFEALFRQVVERGDEVLGVFLSGELSGTFQSAVIARELVGAQQDVYKRQQPDRKLCELCRADDPLGRHQRRASHRGRPADFRKPESALVLLRRQQLGLWCSHLRRLQLSQLVFQHLPGRHTHSQMCIRDSIIHVPEGRLTFPGLTVYQNLEVGTISWHGFISNKKYDREIEEVFTLFPKLRERRDQMAWSLSGGEQQMLAIGRGLMGRPKLLMLDEPSMGLAPLIVEELFKKIVEINKLGISVLLIEQNARLALKAVSYTHLDLPAAARRYSRQNSSVPRSWRGRELRSRQPPPRLCARRVDTARAPA